MKAGGIRPFTRLACYVLAGLLGLFSLWCLLWVLSSWSMAFSACSGTYELFSPTPRCRQPAIAGLLALASLLAALVAVLIARRSGVRVEQPYRRRTALRRHLPWFLIDMGLANKGRDCEVAGGEHEWYNKNDRSSACYHCEVARSGRLWEQDDA